MLGAGNNCRQRKQGGQAPAPPRIKQKNSLRKRREAQTVFVFPTLSVSSAYPDRPVFLGRDIGIAERENGIGRSLWFYTRDML